MVNYRRVLCEVAFLSVLVAVANAAPTPDCTQNHYDQRQNGSENYRLNIDGVVVAVAPAESLFSALGDMDDLMELLALEEFNGDYKPKPPSTSSSSSWTDFDKPKPEEKPTEEKPKPQDKPTEEKPKPEDKPTEEQPTKEKPTEEKPAEEKPTEEKPLKENVQETKPEESKPEVPAKPVELSPLSDVSLNEDFNIQKKEVSNKKQEKANRSS